MKSCFSPQQQHATAESGKEKKKRGKKRFNKDFFFLV